MTENAESYIHTDDEDARNIKPAYRKNVMRYIFLYIFYYIQHRRYTFIYRECIYETKHS